MCAALMDPIPWRILWLELQQILLFSWSCSQQEVRKAMNTRLRSSTGAPWVSLSADRPQVGPREIGLSGTLFQRYDNCYIRTTYMALWEYFCWSFPTSKLPSKLFPLMSWIPRNWPICVRNCVNLLSVVLTFAPGAPLCSIRQNALTTFTRLHHHRPSDLSSGCCSVDFWGS